MYGLLLVCFNVSLTGGIDKMNTLFRIVFHITILLIVFNLSLSLITSISGTVFSDIDDPTVVEGNSAIGIFEKLTGLEGFSLGVWGFITGIAGIGVGILSVITKSYTLIGIYLFTTAFWTSYNGAISIINMNSWLPGGFILIISVVMLLLFVGAIIGLTTGNG